MKKYLGEDFELKLLLLYHYSGDSDSHGPWIYFNTRRHGSRGVTNVLDHKQHHNRKHVSHGVWTVRSVKLFKSLKIINIDILLCHTSKHCLLTLNAKMTVMILQNTEAEAEDKLS